MGFIFPEFHTVRISLWWYLKLIIISYSSFFLNRFSLSFSFVCVSFYVSVAIIKTSNTFLSEVPNWIPGFSSLLISHPPPFYWVNKGKTKQSKVNNDNNIKWAYRITSRIANVMNVFGFREKWKCEECSPLVC